MTTTICKGSHFPQESALYSEKGRDAISKASESDSIFLTLIKREMLDDLEEARREAAQANWDGMGAKAADWGSILMTRRLIAQMSNRTAKGDIAISTSGEVKIEWGVDQPWGLTVRVRKDGLLSFAYVAKGANICGDLSPDKFNQELSTKTSWEA